MLLRSFGFSANAVGYKEAGEKYFVQSPKSEPLSREIHIKVRKNGTLMLQKEEEISQTVHQGVDIDVFPVIGISNNDRIKAFQLHLLQTFQNLRYKHSWNVDEGTWIKKAFKRLREHGIQLIESFVWLLAKQLGNRKKNTRCCIVGVQFSNWFPEEKRKLERAVVSKQLLWGDMRKYPFEDTAFFGPGDSDSVLKRFYGNDYMTPRKTNTHVTDYSKVIL